MNSASQNFPHHLGVLRERMMHPNDYEKAVHYFLEEFCGDAEFVRASDTDDPMPHLVAVLGRVASEAVRRRVELSGKSRIKPARRHGLRQDSNRVTLAC